MEKSGMGKRVPRFVSAGLMLALRFQISDFTFQIPDSESQSMAIDGGTENLKSTI
jgi:hypothetical protein